MQKLLQRITEARVRIGLSLFVLLLFIAHAANWVRVGALDRMENMLYDQRLMLTMPGTVDSRIVIVDLDEKSLTAEGRWPWGRNKVAALVHSLFDRYKIGLLGFDVVFAEPDSSSGLLELEGLAKGELSGDTAFQRSLDKARPRLAYDQQFADAIAGYPVVMGYYFNFSADPAAAAEIGTLPAPTFVKGTFTGRNVAFRRAFGFGANLRVLQEKANGAGHFNPVPDPDGVVRRVPMLIEHDGAYYGSLSLEMARRAMGAAKEVVPGFGEPLFGGRAYPGLEWLQIGAAGVPVDRYVQALVPYRGRRFSFNYVSATDVLNGRTDPQLLKGAVVLVGTTAPGLLDLRATPVGEAYPGVEVHANLIAGILDGTIKQLPEYTLGAEVVLLVLFGVVFALAAGILSPLASTILTGAMLLLYIGINLLAWSAASFVLPLASGLLMLTAMFILNMSYGYFVETRGKRQITGLFGQYIPPELVDEMSRDPAAYSLAAESRELSVLFSDVRGFTTISEGLPPKELADLMNQFLTPMTRVIHEQRGTIDKYMGDAIMAFWGAPIADDAHAVHAVRAGMEMLARVAEVNRIFTSRGWPSLQIGIGINSGPMSVGNMGSEFRMAYTVLGDAVNLGSRLESLTKSYGVEILVSESTRDAVPEYAYREIDRVKVKGKEQPITIYEPLGLRETLDGKWKDELKLLREALKRYRAQEWDMAEMNFLNLARTSRSPQPYRLYVERIATFRTAPPPRDWDGVYTHTSK
jgi:adenylate cyclase